MEKTVSETPALDWCVVGTLAWFGVLGRPLRLPELRRLLLKRSATETELRDTLGELGELVTEHHGYYSLRGTAVTYPEAESERWYRYKWGRVWLAVWLLRLVPFVRLVGVGNTLADRTASKDSDIDVFIVIEHGRLYLTRLLITIILQVTGLRRHGRKIANRICLSFYATTRHLDLSDIAFAPYDLYLAYWVTELTPVFATGETYHEFLTANRWVGSFVPGYAKRRTQLVRSGLLSRIGEFLLGGMVGDFLESRIAAWQQRRIDTSPRAAEPDVQIIATDSMLKFHEKERRKVYRAAWETAMRQAGYDPSEIV